MVLRPGVLSLFTGVGGLDLGLRLGLNACGVYPRTVLYVEREAYSAACLVARMEEQALDRAPVWSDVGTLGGRCLGGKVDIVSAGFPCQDISIPGSKKGLRGARSGLFYEVVRLVRECGPRIVFLENVANLATMRGGEVREEVLSQLEREGYQVRDCVISAESVGAPHLRRRWFGLAVADGYCGRLPRFRPGDFGLRKHESGEQLDRRDPGFRQFPPRPDSGWISERTEELPCVPTFRGTADGFPPWVGESGKFRVDRLRALGNAVVPDQAASAFLCLLEEFDE